MSTSVPNFYDLLGLQPNASTSDIKVAFRRKALLSHPDKNQSKEAEETMKLLNQAYETLSSGRKKAAYDAKLEDDEGGGAPVDIRHWLFGEKSPAQIFREQMDVWKQEWSLKRQVTVNFSISYQERFDVLTKERLHKEWGSVFAVPEAKLQCMRCDAYFLSENELANHKEGGDGFKELLASLKGESSQTPAQVIADPSSPFRPNFRLQRELPSAVVALARSACECFDAVIAGQVSQEFQTESKENLVARWLNHLHIKLPQSLQSASFSVRPNASTLAELRGILEEYPRATNKRCTAKNVSVFSVANQQALLNAFSLSRPDKFPSVQVREPPAWVPDKTCPRCQQCTTKFGLFGARRHHCRGCGRCLCIACVSKRPIPKFGFQGSVFTCQNCIATLRNETAAALLTQAKSADDNAIVMFLGAAHEIFGFEDEKKWAQLGDEIKSNRASLLCCLYANLGAEKWSEMSLKQRSDPALFAFCLETFASCQPTQTQWKQLYGELTKAGVSLASRFHVLQASGMSSDEWLAQGKQAFTKGEYEWSWFCFLAVAKKLSSAEWIKKGNAFIPHEVLELTVQYYKVGEAPISSYLELLLLIDQQPATYRRANLGSCMKVIELLFYGGRSASSISAEWDNHSRSPAVLSSPRLAWMLLNRGIVSDSPSVWLDHCMTFLRLGLSSSKLQVNAMSVANQCLAKALSYEKFDWQKHGERLHNQSDNISQASALLCSRIHSRTDWDKMGREALIVGRFEEASKYFLMAGQGVNTCSWWEKQAHSFESEPLLALKCYVTGWSLSHNHSSLLSAAQCALKANQTQFAVSLCAAILRDSPSRKEEARIAFLMVEVLQEAKFGLDFQIQAYELAEQRLSPEPLPEQHQRRLQTLVKAQNKGEKGKESPQVRQLQKLFSEGKYAAFYKLLLGEIFNSDDRSRQVIVDEFLTLQLSYGPLEPRSAPDKGTLLLVRGVQHLLRGQWTTGVQELLNAALVFPHREAIWGPVADILSCPRFRTKLFVQELRNILDHPFQSLCNAQITIKKEYEQKDKLRPNVESRLLFSYERGIQEQFSRQLDSTLASREVALSYRNLAAAGQSHTSAVMSLVHSALWFLADIDRQPNVAEKYVSKRAIVDTLVEAYALSCRGSIAERAMIGRIGAGILIQAVHKLSTVQQGGFVSSEELERESQLAFLFLSTYFDSLPLYPVPPSLQVARVGDWQYIGLIQHMLVQQMFRALQVHAPTALLPSHVLNYYRYEADLMGWCREGPDSDDDEEDEKQDSDFELDERDSAARDRAKQVARAAREERKLELSKQRRDARRRLRAECIETMLASKDWDVGQVQSLLQWSMLPRTPDGWILPERHQLKLKGEGFASIDGVTFDIETGDIQLLLRKPKHGEHALFDWSDVAAVMQHGIGSSFFSLDAPSAKFTYHPFQLMRFSPPELWGTDYLATMFHTDYLLKFFSTGMEVAALPPFDLRPSAAGLVARLPPKLQAVVQSIPNRRGRSCIGAAHRFWIEAGEIPYSADSAGRCITFRFGRVPMQVKKHLLEHDEKGNLVDASDADDMMGGLGSAETRFAVEFSENFDEIGQYFPEFLRLRELLKLSAVVNVIVSHRTQLQEDVSNPERVTKQAVLLDAAHREMDLRRYPQASNSLLISKLLDENIESNRSRVQREHGYSAWTSSLESQARAKLRPEIEQSLREADDQLLTTLYSQFTTSTGKSKYSLQSDVLSFLKGNSRPLAQAIVTYQSQKPLDAFNRQLERIKFHAPSRFATFSNSSGSCVWVPSSIRQESIPGALFSVYGGVCLNVSLKQSYIAATSAVSTSLNASSQQPVNQYGSASRTRHIENSGLKGLVQNHHVIPQSLANHSAASAVLQRANFSMHHQSNIMLMPNKQGASAGINTNRSVHQGSHAGYNSYVAAQVIQIGKDTNHLPPAFTQARLNELRSSLRQEIRSGTAPWK